MNSKHFTALFALVCCTIVTPGVAADEPGSSAYHVVSQGTRKLDRPDGSDFVKILVEAANLGGDEVEVGEITFAPGYWGSAHPHGSLEIFYVLSGQLTHWVEGVGAALKPGMIGIVRPGDQVEHINETDAPVKTLVIWVPGGEVERSFGGAEMTPIDAVDIP